VSDKSLDVEVTFLTPDEGGRALAPNLRLYRTVVIAGLRDVLSKAEADGKADHGLFGVQFEQGPAESPVGEPQLCVMRPLVCPEGMDDVSSVGEFTICEGTRVVGHGRVLGWHTAVP
jgi:hypothetical protein